MRTSTAWLVLLLSAVLEAVWATSLGASHGLSRLGPTLLFAVTLTLSQIGLALAMRRIPLGTAYAIWVGIGAALTVTWAGITGAEPVSWLKIVFIVGIVGCVVGLKLATPSHADAGPPDADPPSASGATASAQVTPPAPEG